jgi:hypothetical protein
MHWLNSDFDLTLRRRQRGLRPELARQVRELTVQALLGADANDSVVLGVQVPPEFLDHLAVCGLVRPRLLQHPELDPSGSLAPFGWSAEAMELNGRTHAPVPHPELEVVRRVNGKSYGTALERELDPAGPVAEVMRSAAELERFLAAVPRQTRWLVKAEHGHSALANRRLSGAGLTPDDRGFVERRLEEDERLVVEPWLPRDRDFCVVLQVPFDPRSVRVHETVCTADGALIGASFEPAGPAAPADADLRRELAETARAVASRLAADGYFGPACFDAFTWRDGEAIRLRRLADLNCRRSMSHWAHACWRRIAPDRRFFFRFFNRRKLRFPRSLGAAQEALGARRFDPARRAGVLLASPPEVADGGRSRSPNKLAVAFVGGEREDVASLERWFRDRFEARA